MTKTNILKKNYQFQAVISHRRYLVNSQFCIYYKKNINNNLQYGISVSKKLGNAVIRNKVKRQLRAMLKSIEQRYDLPFDLVIIVRKNYLNTDFIKNKAKLISLFNKINQLQRRT